MGLRFRKSKKIGPFRVNISKSGIGYSFGNKYARVTHTADGKKRTTYTLPGTGVSWSETNGKKKGRREMGKSKQKKQGGCLNSVLIILGILFVIGIFGGNKSEDSSADITIPTVSVTESITEAIDPTETTVQTEALTEATTEVTMEPTTEPETTAATTEPTTEPETTAATTEPVEEFFIANKNTKKYHHTWCSYAPNENSKNYWLTNTTRDSLEQRGYAPCKKCF